MVPFVEKETGRILPRGKTRLPDGITFIHPEDAPDDEARVLIERYRGENLPGGGSMSIPEPLTVDILGREGKDIYLVPRSGKTVALTYEPPVDVQVERILRDMDYERYFPLAKRIIPYMEKQLANAGRGKQILMTAIFTFPLLGAITSDYLLISPPIKVHDFLTKHWQKERIAVETELKEKKGLASGR